MRYDTRVVREEVKERVTGTTYSSRLDLFVQPGFEQISQESAVSVPMRNTILQCLSRMLGDEVKRSSPSLSVTLAVERVINLTAEMNDLLIP